MDDYTNKYKGEQIEVALFGGEYQEGVLTAYCSIEDVPHIELNGHILVPLQNVASLHCSSRCDAPEPDWPPRGLEELDRDERPVATDGGHRAEVPEVAAGPPPAGREVVIAGDQPLAHGLGHGLAGWADLVAATNLPPLPAHVRDVAWRCYAQIFVRNVDRSAAWYEDVLGFEIDYRYGDPPFYAQVRRNAVAMNLRRTETSPWAVNAADEDLLAARLEVDDVKSLFLELRGAGASIHHRLRAEPWGQLTFVVRDPDDNLISFGSPMP